MYIVVGFIGYMIALAVDKKQMGQMIALVTILIVLQVTIQAVAPVIDKIDNLLNSKGTLPVQGEITQYFDGVNHHGIDIAVPEGTPVYSDKYGQVVYADDLYPYGQTLIIDYGGKITWLFGHNSKLLVSKGETVYRGEKICLTGSSGVSSGPHLHFEVRKNGVAVDPLPYLE